MINKVLYIGLKHHSLISEITKAIYGKTNVNSPKIIENIMGVIINNEPIKNLYKYIDDRENTKMYDDCYTLKTIYQEIKRDGINKITNLIPNNKKLNLLLENKRKMLQKVLKMYNNPQKFSMYRYLYSEEFATKTYEEIKRIFEDESKKKELRNKFLKSIEYTNILKKKQSKKYTVSRDADKDVYYITCEGRLAKIAKWKLEKHIKKREFDLNENKAIKVFEDGKIVKPMKLINKIMPKANENMKLLLASMFEGLKECKMIIDTDFKKAYTPYYTTHQDTDRNKASNYSCMSGYGEDAQQFYGKIHGCKVVRWETKDGEQVGRCIMYEHKGIRHFIRIYGLYAYHRTMINMLEAQMKQEDMFGRDKVIPNMQLKTDFDENTNCLYLDGNEYGIAKDLDNDGYIISDNYEYDCKTTSRDTIRELMDAHTCENCRDTIHDHDDEIIINGEHYCCSECANNAGYIYCERCCDWQRDDNYVCIGHNMYCCSDCAEADGWRYCDNCSEWFDKDEAIYIDGNTYCCSECAENAGYSYDNYNEKWTYKNNIASTEDEQYYTTKAGAANHYGVDIDQIEYRNYKWCVIENNENNENNN